MSGYFLIATTSAITFTTSIYPGEHSQLVIVAESLVEQQDLGEVPHFLSPDAWRELDALVAEGDYWEMLLDSDFAKPTPALVEARERIRHPVAGMIH